MKIITVTLISESLCAYEKPSDSFYEVWSTDGIVYRIDGGKIYPPLELTDGRRIVDENVSIGVGVVARIPWLTLRWFDGVEIQWHTPPDADLALDPIRYDVDPILRIRMYSIQPTTLHCNKHDHIIQGVGDISIFQSTVSGNQTFKCNSEMKWIPSHIIDPIHECLSVTIDDTEYYPEYETEPAERAGRVVVDPSVYWNDKLYSIWRNYLEPTMMNVISNGDSELNTLIPLSVSVEGIPCSHDRGVANTFEICKGLSCQSFWYLSPGTRIVTDEWIHYHLTTILRLHGSTIDRFCDGPIDHIALNDAMKLATIHVTTWPFIMDRRFGYSRVSGQLEQYDIDKFDCSTKFGGDCEDGAMFVVKLIHSILSRVNGPSYVMKLRSCYAFLGIPVGLSGQSKGGNATANHMYGAMIPYRFFGCTNENEINKKFNIKGSNQTITLIETTMMTSFQYSNHEMVSNKKREAFNSIRELHIDNDCLWKNYTLLMPLSFQKEYGSWRHERMNRIFTFSHYLFTGKQGGIQGTYTINNGKGTLAKNFFSSNPTFTISLPSVQMTPKVFNDEIEVLKAFECPITPLEPMTMYPMMEGCESDHINVYCWKKNEETQSVINKIKTKLKIISNPIIFPYGHGEMIQFKL